MGSRGSHVTLPRPPAPNNRCIGVLGARGCSEPPRLAPEPLRRLNPSSHEPGGPQGLVPGRRHWEDRDREGKGRAVLLFGLGPGMSQGQENT